MVAPEGGYLTISYVFAAFHFSNANASKPAWLTATNRDCSPGTLLLERSVDESGPSKRCQDAGTRSQTLETVAPVQKFTLDCQSWPAKSILTKGRKS